MVWEKEHIINVKERIKHKELGRLVLGEGVEDEGRGGGGRGKEGAVERVGGGRRRGEVERGGGKRRGRRRGEEGGGRGVFPEKPNTFQVRCQVYLAESETCGPEKSKVWKAL